MEFKLKVETMSLEKASKGMSEEELAQFDWLDLHNEMDKALPQETKLDKLVRKCKENPLVPIGMTKISF